MYLFFFDFFMYFLPCYVLLILESYPFLRKKWHIHFAHFNWTNNSLTSHVIHYMSRDDGEFLWLFFNHQQQQSNMHWIQPRKVCMNKYNNVEGEIYVQIKSLYIFFPCEVVHCENCFLPATGLYSETHSINWFFDDSYMYCIFYGRIMLLQLCYMVSSSTSFTFSWLVEWNFQPFFFHTSSINHRSISLMDSTWSWLNQ